MTVKLLMDWPDSRDGKQYVAGNLLTTDAGTETGLVDAKMATTTLTGGTAYVAPAVQAQYLPVMASTNLTGGIGIPTAGGEIPAMTFPLPGGQSGVPILLPGAGSFNASGLLTLTNAITYSTFPFSGKVYLSASNGLAAGLYECSVTAASTIQLSAPNNVTTAGAYASTTGEVILVAANLPAHTLGKNGHLYVRHVWGMSNSGLSKTMKVKLGGDEMANLVASTSAGFSALSDLWNDGTELGQWKRNSGAGSSGIGSTTGLPIKGGVDTSVDSVIYITGQLNATSDFLTLHGYSIEVSHLN